MTLKNCFRKCLLFVLSANGWKEQNMDSSFSRQRNPNMEMALFVDQSCCSMTSKQFLESSSGMKFVYPSVRLANQNPGAFVSVRYTNQIALFPFVCCFCFVRAFSLQGHTKIALTSMQEKTEWS